MSVNYVVVLIAIVMSAIALYTAGRAVTEVRKSQRLTARALELAAQYGRIVEPPRPCEHSWIDVSDLSSFPTREYVCALCSARKVERSPEVV